MNDSPASARAPAPSPSSRVVVTFLAAHGAFALSYLVTTLRRLPVPWYHPLRRAWTFESYPADFAMGWFGWTAAALGCAVIAGLLAWIASSRGPVAAWLSRPATVLGIARAGGFILLVDLAYFGWVLMHQSPAAPPLPDWYCPR